MEKHYNVIIFKDITSGFMNADKIINLAKKFEKNQNLKESTIFVLLNNSTIEKNQSIMQMFNGLIGLDIFKFAFADNKAIKYNFLEDRKLCKENIITQELNSNLLKQFLQTELQTKNIKYLVIEDDVWKGIEKIFNL